MLQHGPYHYCLTLEYAMRELYGSNSRWYQSAGLYSEPKEVREALLDRDGVEIRIPEFALPVLAQRVRQGGGWRITDNVMNKHSFLEYIPEPYVLEPDDVITMRLRARPGIDWSERWTLDKFNELATGLKRPIGAVRVVAIYRRGHHVVRQPFVIKDLTVLQQEIYVSRIRELTNNTDR